jgi:hypothetical protein
MTIVRALAICAASWPAAVNDIVKDYRHRIVAELQQVVRKSA